jgi:hypothetical protein
MPIGFKERLELLQRMSLGWLDLKKAINGMAPHEPAVPLCPGCWTGRDLILHIAISDEELTGRVLELDEGNPGATPVTGDWQDEASNEHKVDEYRNLSIADAVDFFEQAHFDLMEVLERSPSLTAALVEPAIAHYREHLAQVTQRPRRR